MKSKNKKECKFNVTMDLALQFKIECIKNKRRMNDVISQLMCDYINDQKNSPPE